MNVNERYVQILSRASGVARPDRRSGDDGGTETMMLARGFSIDMTVELINPFLGFSPRRALL
jgi:hypothetical protein